MNFLLRSLKKNILLQKCCSKNYSDGVNFENKPFDLHLLTDSPKTTVTLTKQDAIKYLDQMYVIRKMENAAAVLYREKKIIGFCHLYSGQEACAVGIKASVRPEDTLITSYRAHGFTWLCGESVGSVLGELTGRSIGCSRGKGGSMHMYAKHFFGGNGIVAAHVPLGTGIALAHKKKENGLVSVTLYGDGAANQGQVFEAFNIAKLWTLPVMYVCENNMFGMGTATHRAAYNDKYYTRCDYIPGVRLDGMDVLAVREATRFALEYILSGKGPIILELLTYRYFGHSMSDPGTSYRSREEIQKVRDTRDPINFFKERVITAGLLTVEEVKAIEEKSKAVVEVGVKEALAGKVPPDQDVAYDIYSNNLFGKIRNNLVFNGLEHKNLGLRINLK